MHAIWFRVKLSGAHYVIGVNLWKRLIVIKCVWYRPIDDSDTFCQSILVSSMEVSFVNKNENFEEKKRDVSIFYVDVH